MRRHQQQVANLLGATQFQLKTQRLASWRLEAGWGPPFVRASGLQRRIDDLAQLAQMLGPGIDLHQHAARFEYAGEFRIHRKAEHAQHAIERRIHHRQVCIAADKPGRIALLLRRRLHRPFGDIQPDQRQRPGRGVGRGELAQVVALAAARIKHVHDTTPCVRRQHAATHRLCNRLVMARIEKTPARRDHLLAVTRIPRALVLHGQKMDIAFTSHIEAVTGRTAPHRPGGLQRQAVERAGESLKRKSHERAA